MIKLYICCLVLIIESVEVGLDIDVKFHQEVMEIVSYCDTDIPDNQTSKALQEDNYHTAINDDEKDDTIQFGNPVTQLFLSRSIRVPITEVGCLSFTQMLKDYLHAYLPPMQADGYSQIQGMAQWLDMFLSK